MLHIQFSPLEWGIWATEMIHQRCGSDYPPRTPEFEQALLQHRSKSHNKRKAKNYNNSDNENDDHKGIKIINMTQQPYHEFPVRYPHSDLYPPPYLRRYSDPSNSPRKPSVKMSVTESLKAVGYVPLDWIGKGLEDYFNWLNDQFEGLNLQDLIEAVRKQGVGLDSLGTEIVDVKFLTENCGISSGDALRILTNFGRWLHEKLSAKE